MSKINTIKGFADHLPIEAERFTRMAETAARIFSSYGYKEIHIPILEYTELFSRSIGTETDVVQKEMFTFPDRKDRSLTMRPEATAGIMRAYIENSIHAKQAITKYYTHGPMFRYERPQKGRMRQFHQIDAECLGVEEPHVDAEMLMMLMDFLGAIGLTDLSLELNTLGCKKCRPKYRDLLTSFLQSKPRDEFCEDCRRRIETSPLRVLDCKAPRCKELTVDAPAISCNVCPECAAHFAVVRGILDRAKTPYHLNNRLVRGLDYYTRTTFEAVSGGIGSQSSVTGGGRYDGLISSLGGPEVPGIGFACGMERLNLLMPELPAKQPDFYLAALEEKTLTAALLLAQTLRAKGYAGETAFTPGSLKSQMRRASANNARYCLILGGSELEKGTVLVKNMQTGDQTEVPQPSLDYLK